MFSNKKLLISSRGLTWIVISFLVLLMGGALLYFFSQIKISPTNPVETAIVEPIPPTATRLVRLYFFEADNNKLVPEIREIVIVDEEFSQQAKQILSELIKGPVSDSLGMTLPATTKVRTLFLDSDHCLFVDFDEAFLQEHCGGTAGELITIGSLIYTLSDAFAEVASIQILVEGNPIDQIANHLDLSRDRFYVVDWLN